MSQWFQIYDEGGTPKFRMWGSPLAPVPSFLLWGLPNSFQTTSKIVDFEGPQKPRGASSDRDENGDRRYWD